jgi:predicted DNA-binding transcriptional regulator AlpA
MSISLAPSEMLNAKESAAFLGVSVRAFYDLGLPCYKMGPRLTRWARADLEEFKQSCRCISTKTKAAGVSDSAVVLTASVTSLRNSFQKAGAAPRPKRTTARKADVYTLKPPG